MEKMRIVCLQSFTVKLVAMRGYQSNTQPARESNDTRQINTKKIYIIGVLQEKCKESKHRHMQKRRSKLHQRSKTCAKFPSPESVLSHHRERREKKNFKRKVRSEQLRLIAGRSGSV
ncbi:hypothetical protein B0T12DRAFT_258475 [Alternaria alternata]|nr:hypothetical protein B0T12DRAFT_258475 [Alternaria alternata]